MKKFIKTGIALTAAAMFLSGCGEGLMVMNEKEEAIVVSYSAGALAKRNRYQPEGLTAVYQGEEDEAEEEEPKEAAEKEEPAEIEAPEEKAQEPGSAEAPGGEAQEPGEAAAYASLTDALGLKGIQVSYQDYFISDTYQQGDYYILNAKEGNTFVILNFNIANSGAGETLCDILSLQPIFTLDVEGEAGIRNEVTMLDNDMATYKKPVGPGQTDTAVLLFEVPKDAAEAMSGIRLSLLVDGEANDIALD